MREELTLRLPGEHEEHEFLRAHRATSPDVPSFLLYYAEGMPFRQYLDLLADQQRGTNLPADHVPATFLFAYVGSRIVGRVSMWCLPWFPSAVPAMVAPQMQMAARRMRSRLTTAG
jgi:predicted acetyltransferase